MALICSFYIETETLRLPWHDTGVIFGVLDLVPTACTSCTYQHLDQIHQESNWTTSKADPSINHLPLAELCIANFMCRVANIWKLACEFIRRGQKLRSFVPIYPRRTLQASQLPLASHVADHPVPHHLNAGGGQSIHNLGMHDTF